MDQPTEQSAPAGDDGHAIPRLLLVGLIVGLSIIDLLVSSQAWVFVATLGIIVIALAFAVRMSWARPVMGYCRDRRGNWVRILCHQWWWSVCHRECADLGRVVSGHLVRQRQLQAHSSGYTRLTRIRSLLVLAVLDAIT